VSELELIGSSMYVSVVDIASDCIQRFQFKSFSGGAGRDWVSKQWYVCCKN
jgi:hypothetical protein